MPSGIPGYTLAPEAGSTDPTRWIRRRCAPAFSLLFVLQRAVTAGGVDPKLLRARLEAAIVGGITWDEEARAAGFTAAEIQRIRLALIATADEITQRSGSACDYSVAPPPGEPPLLQQKHFKAWRAGHTFFEELEATLQPPRLSPVGRALLELFALCLAYGFHGKYEAHDIAGYGAIRARVTERLRIAAAPGPPRAPANPWPRPPTASPWPWRLALAALAAALAALITYRVVLTRQALEVRGYLGELTENASPRHS